MKDKSKVVVGTVEQGSAITPAGQEELRDAQRQQEDLNRIESIKQARRNKLAEMLDAKIYILDWTHPCLFNREMNRQLAVTEFYPDLNLAVDKFFHFDEWEISLTGFKKQTLNDAGFKYAFLTPEKDFADILAEIESQSVEKVA